MNNVIEALKEISDTPVSSRHQHILTAYLGKYLTKEQFLRIEYNVMQQFWRNGEYRANRPIPTHGDKQAIRDQNAADAHNIEEMTEFKTEHGLEMSPQEDSWYEYLWDGTLSGDVEEYMLTLL